MRSEAGCRRAADVFFPPLIYCRQSDFTVEILRLRLESSAAAYTRFLAVRENPDQQIESSLLTLMPQLKRKIDGNRASNDSGTV